MEIWAALATETSEQIATHFVMAIREMFEPLRHFRLSGRARAHLAPGFRVTFHSSHAVYHKPFPDSVVVVRVIHGARDVATLVERGRFA